MLLAKRIGERELTKTLERPPILEALAYVEGEFRIVASAFAYTNDPREHHFRELANKAGELLAACKEFGFGFGNDHDPIRRVADIAQRTLAVANNGNYPRSSEIDAPLTKLVSALMGEIGMSRSRSTIKAVLQGLRRK